ncbi:DEAD/DEAH box helicase [Thermogutta sp.]|uniref:DEAD/DEAH box helicase n=1 Tax=Thermogutta sp. TaxID=1962930 RepID=UPI0025D8EBDF|nr:DEAD/DEAH box helicase [Thermogutta sp.]
MLFRILWRRRSNSHAEHPPFEATNEENSPKTMAECELPTPRTLTAPAGQSAPLDTYEPFTLSFRIDSYVTGWNRGLERGLPVETQKWELAGPAFRVLALNPGASKIEVKSFFFFSGDDAPSSEGAPANDNAASGPAIESGTAGPANAPGSARHCATINRPGAGHGVRCDAAVLLERLAAGAGHRIHPPEDVIKLEDRLHYLLQPPLEFILAQRQLEFPHTPFPYQLEGVAFLFPRHAAILADEMGLGKTMQAITAIRLLLRCGEVRRVLLVCPKPLVSNWRREFELWAPEIPVMVIEGEPQRRRWQWELTTVPVKIANYELLPRDQEFFTAKDESGEPKVSFDLVVLDESQRIKNRSGATSQAVRAISRKRSWALTGTPVENSTDDLVGIFEFLSPGFLTPDMKPHRLGTTIADFVLRRTKDQVLTDLPPKLFRDAEIELTPEQWKTYEMAEKEGVLRLSELGAEITIQHVFELVIRLKQICNFDPVTGASAKMERLEADLEELADSGRKAIIFSQWVATLEEIGRRLPQYRPLYFHGRIPPQHREEVIRRFREDPQHRILLMSYGAGSVGLNLQFVNYVFLFDRWWNPAVEDQAINRAHRIGAAGPVIVTRFLAVDTIEQRINTILEQKRALFETIFSATAPKRLALTQEEIFSLFNLQAPQTAKAA